MNGQLTKYSTSRDECSDELVENIAHLCPTVEILTGYCEEFRWEGGEWDGKYKLHGHIPIEKTLLCGKIVFIKL